MAGRKLGPQGFAHPVDEQPVVDHSCSAFGCPLPGVFSTSTKGSPPYQCFVHSATAALDAQEVTRRIRQREWLWRLIAWVGRMDRCRYESKTWRPQLAARLAELGHPDLEPRATESKYAYVARLRAWMLAECTAGLRERAAQQQRTEDAHEDGGWLALDAAFRGALGMRQERGAPRA